MNELIFILQSITVAGAVLIALRIGSAALIALAALQAICANFFVLKQINLCSYNATASDAYAIGGLLALNVLQEYYGPELARRAIGISFGCMVLFMIVSQLHLAYAPSTLDVLHPAYCSLLMHTPRIIVASFVTYGLMQLFDAALYRTFKRITGGRWYLLRNYASVLISQLGDTIMFSFLGLYGIVDNLTDIIFVSYSIKLLVTLCATPFLALTRNIKKGP
jgi:uncharacterized integral membrane protein (TIGR00697 family)